MLIFFKPLRANGYFGITSKHCYFTKQQQDADDFY